MNRQIENQTDRQMTPQRDRCAGNIGILREKEIYILYTICYLEN